MYNKNALPLASLSAALFSALYTSSAISAAPDPGNIQREQQRLESPKREPNTAEHPLQINENEATKPLDNGTRLTVKQFRINGNTAFGEEELIRLLAPYLGHELTFPKLQEAIDRISMHYRQQGYFVARAFLPAQTIQDGIVSIIVSEGRLGQVNVYVDGRAKPETITDIIHHQLAENDLLKLDKVERAILLVGDLAGFNTRATLEPGVGSGLSDLRVDVKEGPLFTGSVDADNFGSRYTGEARAGFTGNINSPTGRGDQATIRLNHTSHMNYGRLAYTTPLGNDGLKVGASLYDMRYDLCCNNTFTRLDYRGSAQGWGLNALYPIKRSQNRNLSAVIGYEAKDIQGRSDLGKTSDRDSRAVRFELNGDHADNYFGGGLNNYGISYTIGNMDINLAAERMNDRFAARTDGGWNKTNLSAVRLQHVTDRLTLYVAFNGQYAPHNLDTSEKFSLGGVYGVRAYPQSEAIGDHGYLLNAELRWAIPADLPGSLQLAGFIDHGGIRQHANTWQNWSANPGMNNHYTLSGAGAWLGYTDINNFSLRATLAFKIGSNEGEDLNGHDSDGRDRNPRLWLQAAKFF